MPVPVPSTPLIGRDAEIAAIEARLGAGARLLTLLGSPGVGKTRLATQVALDHSEAAEGSVAFVPLDAIEDPDFVIAAIARALGVREAVGSPLLDAVKAHLRARTTLLVLDNFEQVLPAASMVAGLLQACSSLQLIVTSRAPLRLSAEELQPVEPLSLPPTTDVAGAVVATFSASDALTAIGESAAVRLFLQRIRAVRPSLALSLANAADVAAICTGLDGLPLALELAAARTRLFSLRELAERLTGRLALLVGGPTDLPPRQRTLRAAISWSYALLSAEEQRVFRLLSVFAGGGSFEAIAFVAAAMAAVGSVPDLLVALIDQSLVRRREDVNGASRFGMLETIREYAAERLEAAGEAEAARLHAAAWMLAIVRRPPARRADAEQQAWLDRLELEHDNLRTLLQWTTDSEQAALALELAVELWPFWHARGYLAEGRRWLDRALTAAERAPDALRAACLLGAATLAEAQGDFAGAAPLAERSLALYRELGADGAADALVLLGQLAYRRSDYETAYNQGEESLALAEAAGNRRLAARCLNLLGNIAVDGGQFGLARERFERGLEHAEAAGDRRICAIVLQNLGLNAHRMNRYQEARGYLERALALHRQLGVKVAIGQNLSLLAMVARGLDDSEAALAFAAEALALAGEIGNRSGIASALNQLTPLARARGDLAAARAYSAAHLTVAQEIDYPMAMLASLTEAALNARAEGSNLRAARLFAASEAQREAMGLAQHPGMQQMLEGQLAELNHALGSRVFYRAWAEGTAMSRAEAVAHALAGASGDSTEPAVQRTAELSAPAVTEPAPASAGPKYPGGLTERQVEVLRLLAAGRSNQQIAESLVVSERTVEHHIRSIYHKIDVQNRVEATAYAHRTGLVG